MKTNGNDKTLESYKIFPYVAWGITFIFAFFVYQIAVELKETADALEAQAIILQQHANTPVGEIRDFSR